MIQKLFLISILTCFLPFCIIITIHVFEFLGTPSSLNLRNIVWHGFSSTSSLKNEYQEISSTFVSTIYILLRTLGKRIEHFKKLSATTFQLLPRKNYSLQKVVEMYSIFDSSMLDGIVDMLELEMTHNLKNSNKTSYCYISQKHEILQVCF